MRHLGRAEEAATGHTAAVRILERVGEPHRRARSLLAYAEACLATGDKDAAARHFGVALELVTAFALDYLAPKARSGLNQAS
ncbi:tetratricopeptide repeat protein [Streptomyces triticiradicis]|uniref:Tetratricopeptide repeat protein n=1 Tax=Streptomyces triticiradicis TaxID=2651189 RepID=A0A7J5D7L2_9ACTN|nr:tetratricopeptide repeat protein [Streptomyces triticiradicis]KAB1979594.1 tetratricopeptide repeat protein [Streptomyces triticiradicis]